MTLEEIQQHIDRGRRAITLAREWGADTSAWEKELARLERIVADAEHTASRTEELLRGRGGCPWRCEALNGEVIAVARDRDVPGVPRGCVLYTEAELRELCGGDRGVSRATLRLVHEAKKRGARVTGRGQ